MVGMLDGSLRGGDIPRFEGGGLPVRWDGVRWDKAYVRGLMGDWGRCRERCVALWRRFERYAASPCR